MLASQAQSLAIRPTLKKLNLWSLSAEELVLGTTIVEGGLLNLKQHYNAPLGAGTLSKYVYKVQEVLKAD